MDKYPDIHINIESVGDETLDRQARRLRRVVACTADYNPNDTELEDFLHIMIGVELPIDGLPYIIDEVVETSTEGDIPRLNCYISRSMFAPVTQEPDKPRWLSFLNRFRKSS